MNARPTLRGGRPLLAWSLIGTAILTAFLVGAAGQELATPTTNGANEPVVLKKRARISNIIINRADAVVFSTELADIDNATDVDRVVRDGPKTIRRLTPAVLAETAGGPMTLAQVIAKLGDFQAKWRAEDIAAQTPPP